MPRGGARKGAGRKPNGGRVQKTTHQALRALTDGRPTPLGYILSVMRGEIEYDEVRFRAAKEAAPYMHPKLQAIEHSGEIVSKHESAVDELDKLAQTNTIIATADDVDELENRTIN
jgi:hypothetical protein